MLTLLFEATHSYCGTEYLEQWEGTVGAIAVAIQLSNLDAPRLASQQAPPNPAHPPVFINSCCCHCCCVQVNGQDGSSGGALALGLPTGFTSSLAAAALCVTGEMSQACHHLPSLTG